MPFFRCVECLLMYILIWVSAYVSSDTLTECRWACTNWAKESYYTSSNRKEAYTGSACSSNSSRSLSLSLSFSMIWPASWHPLRFCSWLMRSLKSSRSMNLVKPFPINRSLPSWRGLLELNCVERNKKEPLKQKKESCCFYVELMLHIDLQLGKLSVIKRWLLMVFL